MSKRRGRLLFASKKKFSASFGRAGGSATGPNSQKFFAPLFFKKAAACLLPLSALPRGPRLNASYPCRPATPDPTTQRCRHQRVGSAEGGAGVSRAGTHRGGTERGVQPLRVFHLKEQEVGGADRQARGNLTCSYNYCR